MKVKNGSSVIKSLNKQFNLINIWLHFYKMVFIRINFKNYEICCNSLSEENDILAIGDSNGNIRCLNYKKKFKYEKILKIHELEITRIIIVGSKLISCSHDTRIKIHDIEKRKTSSTLVGHAGAINDIDIFQRSMISASEDGDVKLWDFRQNSSIGKLTHGNNLLSCRFVNNHYFVVSGGISNELAFWDLRMCRNPLDRSKIIKNINYSFQSLCVSNFPTYIFVLDSNLNVHRVRNKPKNCIQFIEAKKQNIAPNVNQLKLNRDDQNKFLLHGNLEGVIFIKSQKNGKILKQFNDHLGAIKEVRMNQNKGVFVSCSMDGSVVIRKTNF